MDGPGGFKGEKGDQGGPGLKGYAGTFVNMICVVPSRGRPTMGGWGTMVGYYRCVHGRKDNCNFT